MHSYIHNDQSYQHQYNQTGVSGIKFVVFCFALKNNIQAVVVVVGDYKLNSWFTLAGGMIL